MCCLAFFLSFALFSRTIKDKRDGYIRNLNGIYDSNLIKVSAVLLPQYFINAAKKNSSALGRS